MSLKLRKSASTMFIVAVIFNLAFFAIVTIFARLGWLEVKGVEVVFALGIIIIAFELIILLAKLIGVEKDPPPSSSFS